MKRFTDTDIWDKTWFMRLSCRLKCVVRHMFDKCDNVGIWEPNYIIASTYVGEDFSEADVLGINEGKQFELLENGKIFIKDFCDFQYGELTETCKPHLPIIKKLKKLGLYERVSKGYIKGMHTLEEKEKEKDIEKEKEKEERGSGGKQKKDKPKLEIENAHAELKSQYSDTIKSLEGKDQNVCWETVKSFIETNAPEFIEPYVDIWNLFAIRHALIKKPIVITDSRRAKIKTRIREPNFKFLEVLKVIQKSAFLKGDNDRKWTVDFDFILENESNYIKIIEEKYK
ncbi:MAG: hypothetical protein QM802_20115 [Agriterribacter sp.]